MIKLIWPFIIALLFAVSINACQKNFVWDIAKKEMIINYVLQNSSCPCDEIVTLTKLDYKAQSEITVECKNYYDVELTLYVDGYWDMTDEKKKEYPPKKEIQRNYNIDTYLVDISKY